MWIDSTVGKSDLPRPLVVCAIQEGPGAIGKYLGWTAIEQVPTWGGK